MNRKFILNVSLLVLVVISGVCHGAEAPDNQRLFKKVEFKWLKEYDQAK